MSTETHDAARAATPEADAGRQDQEAPATPGITIVNGGTVTYGGSIVAGDQIGHSGGIHAGDLIIR